jgi:hypothetical protein
MIHVAEDRHGSKSPLNGEEFIEDLQDDRLFLSGRTQGISANLPGTQPIAQYKM